MLKNQVQNQIQECSNFGIEELCNEMDKLQGKDIIIDIVNGINSVIILDELDFGYVNIGGKKYLSFNTYDEKFSCTIRAEEIQEVYKDEYTNDMGIVLDNGQVLQILCDELASSNGDL